MATKKKHIAVYLDPAVEQALIAFCEQKGLKSKKGTAFSAGVNAVLAEFFGIPDSGASNTPQEISNIPIGSNIPTIESNIPSELSSNIPTIESNIPSELSSNIPTIESNIPTKNIGVGVLPGKSKA